MYQRLYIGLWMLLLTACHPAMQSPALDSHKPSKVLQTFNGQLSAIDATHRWQVLLHWQADLISGYARLTHAATTTIIELKWQKDLIQLRSNKTTNSNWRNIHTEELMHYGMVLPPQTLAKILHNQIPTSLQARGKNIWQGQLYGNTIRIRWQNNHSKLTMTDISHGRTAILRIFP